MTFSTIKFADEPPAPQPRSFWVPRLLITAGFVAAAAVASLSVGFGLF